ncbi:transcription antitermination factor NusB [Candidatus Mesenet endosymbiont of Agriotes lineatus]|uniref:transcription antitermination factor NusB n=1 Tax=Candidatus Mesenet endosymbiont of Agriotes lineatus TaxID=3077948 RepID=UPI0030D5EE84
MELLAKKNCYSRRNIARFLVIQAYYSAMFVDYKYSEELIDYINEVAHLFGFYSFDNQFLLKLLDGIIDNPKKLDTVIESNLSPKWSLTRINLISLAVLRTAAYELVNCDTPVAVVINEYTNISSDLLDKASEISFINAILNKINNT